jgi:hypothetical protein
MQVRGFVNVKMSADGKYANARELEPNPGTELNLRGNHKFRDGKFYIEGEWSQATFGGRQMQFVDVAVMEAVSGGFQRPSEVAAAAAAAAVAAGAGKAR